MASLTTSRSGDSVFVQGLTVVKQFVRHHEPKAKAGRRGQGATIPYVALRRHVLFGQTAASTVNYK